MGAIGSVSSHIVLPSEACFVLPGSLESDWEVSWALLVALSRAIRGLRIEIGESVLVLGWGLPGDLAVGLSLAAGAGLVIGYDPDRSATGGRAFRCRRDTPRLGGRQGGYFYVPIALCTSGVCADSKHEPPCLGARRANSGGGILDIGG